MKRLDVVVATHPHADHIVGLPAVLARVPVGLVLEPGCPDTSAIQADLDVRSPTSTCRSATRAPATPSPSATPLDVLSPDRCWAGTNSDPNNDSLVILLRTGEDTVLFGGEPEEPAQQALLDEGAPLHAELLKVPHHGAATSLPEFFQAVDAELAVISVGPNDYGHPVPSTLRGDRRDRRRSLADRPARRHHRDVRRSGDLGTIRSMSRRQDRVRTLLWGEDEFLLREAALELLGDLRPTEVDAGEWQGGELQDLATPSLFGEPRALLITDAKSLPKEAMAELAAYLAAPDPDAPLVICAQVGERAKVPAALDKLVKPVGRSSR